MRDEQIVDLYWNRDENAIEETEKKYSAYLSQISYHILSDREDSKECVNDTYWKAWNSIPPNRPKILSSYLAKITRQLSIDVFRKKHSIKRGASEYAISISELDELFTDGNTTEGAYEEKLLEDAIGAFLRTLSTEVRTAFIGRYFFFDSVKSVAQYCGMSEARTKSMLYRIRRKLKTYLIKEGFQL